MMCPSCHTDLFCPCSTCQKKTPSKVNWIWDENAEIMICSVCGYEDWPCELPE